MTNNSDIVISVENVYFHYGDKAIHKDLSLEVRRGEILSLIGENGAGKSTLTQMLLGFIKPDRGQVRILGLDPWTMPAAHRKHIGIMSEGHHFYNKLSIDDHRHLQQGTFPDWDDVTFDKLISYFELEPGAKVGTLSMGQKARMSIALCVAQRAELLIWDDPTLGLDPMVRLELIQSIVELVKSLGRTILFTSHVLSDVDRISDRILIMREGQIGLQCSPDEFKSSIARSEFHTPNGDLAIKDIPGLLTAQILENRILVTYMRDEQTQIEKTLGKPIRSENLSLEDAFVAYMSKGRVHKFPELN